MGQDDSLQQVEEPTEPPLGGLRPKEDQTNESIKSQHSLGLAAGSEPVGDIAHTLSPEQVAQLLGTDLK
jgi:hypothetical protein